MPPRFDRDVHGYIMADQHGVLAFSFQNARFEQQELDDYYNVLIGVTGDFTILMEHRILYVEQEFCLAEFAAYAALWWKRVQRAREDFSYQSIESDEEGLVWIRMRNGRWRVGALHQEYEELRSFTVEAIGEAIEGYVSDLQRELGARFGVSLADFIREHEKHSRYIGDI